MEGKTLRHDGVVVPLDTGDQSRFERDTTLAGEIDGMAGPAQQDLHLARPVFVIEFDQRLQFPQMMGVAQGMQYVLHQIIGRPVVMDYDADHSGQNAAARVTVEQQVSPNLNVTYVSNVSSTQQQVIQVEYNVTRTISVVALRDQNGTFGVDIKFKKRLP